MIDLPDRAVPPQRVDLSCPHRLHGRAATRRIERAAMATLPAHALMQRAGLAVARLALALAPHARTFWLACGPGNNGGDGFEAARHLARWGKQPVVSWIGDEARCPPDARAALDRARAAGVPFVDEPPRDLQRHDLAVDALLGIGSSRAPEGPMLEWIGRLRAGPAALLAVDLPSGLDADCGTFAPALAAAREAAKSVLPPSSARVSTLSLLTLKPGLFTASGRDAAGDIWFDDLGCDRSTEPPTAALPGAPPAAPRPHASHKGSFGDVAVIGGGRGMGGAGLLAASAALHGGAGKVYVAPLDHAAAMLDGNLPELMFRRPDALDLELVTAVVGCGGGDAVAAVLPDVLRRAERAVLDADALNAIARDPALRQQLGQRSARGQPTVLTPHPLEAARLLSMRQAHAVQADRLAAARGLVDRFGCTVVLKGSGTVIAAPDRTSAINPTGNGRLATAGTGDVLAGLIGARLAAGEPAWEAACGAVYRHGLAADRWPEDRALTAGRLARAV